MKPSLLCTFFLSCLAFGQPLPGKIAFEVASIKVSDPQPMNQIRMGMNTDDGMLRYSNVSLKDCIRTAYRVKDFQVEGPDWIAGARFDIVAKFPDGASKDQVPEMLQSLLADRFKLTLHRDTKDHAIYALVAAKGGTKLKPAEVQTGDAAATPGKSGSSQMPRGAMSVTMGPDGAHLKAPSATLPLLAEMISRFSERPVVDMTGIQGQYDFDLLFSPETMRGMPGGGRGPMPQAAGDHSPPEGSEPPPSIAESVERYGLKLEPRKAPMEILIVDHIEKSPTEN